MMIFYIHHLRTKKRDSTVTSSFLAFYMVIWERANAGSYPSVWLKESSPCIQMKRDSTLAIRNSIIVDQLIFLWIDLLLLSNQDT